MEVLGSVRAPFCRPPNRAHSPPRMSAASSTKSDTSVFRRPYTACRCRNIRGESLRRIPCKRASVPKTLGESPPPRATRQIGRGRSVGGRSRRQRCLCRSYRNTSVARGSLHRPDRPTRRRGGRDSRSHSLCRLLQLMQRSPTEVLKQASQVRDMRFSWRLSRTPANIPVWHFLVEPSAASKAGLVRLTRAGVEAFLLRAERLSAEELWL